MEHFTRRRSAAISRLAVCAALALALRCTAGGMLADVTAEAVTSVLRRPETAAMLLGGELSVPSPSPTASATTEPAAAAEPTPVPTTAPAVTPQLLYFAAPAESAAPAAVPEIDNNTDYDIDAAALMAEGLADYGGTVLIVHTHTSEAYSTGTEAAGDSYRTEDTSRSVVRVGEELEQVLTARGLTVIHDTTVHDVPYSGAYLKALETIEGEVAVHPEISVVIDLHRDAFSDGAGGTGRTVCTVNGETSAQLLLVMGSDSCGLEHPDWQTNLTLGLFLQAEMESAFPGLARTLCVSENRYNQHVTAGSFILEVGCTGNTLEEALVAVRCFGECCADVLLGDAA